MNANPQGIPSAAKRGLVEGDLLLSGDDFRRIAAMLHADAGIYLPESKATLVYSRLAKRLRVLGLGSFRDYCELVADHAGMDERKNMLVALTTNVTSFFREVHHFNYLRDHALPPLLNAAKQGGRVRIWSAGCSKGHEPYSIAITILSMMPEAASHDIKILATDIDTSVLEHARRGLYEESVIASVPKPERSRSFVPVNEGGARLFGVNDSLRKLVSFRELNLVGQWPMRGSFHAIFCRNVVIYFDEPTQEKIWSRFAQMMEPNGLLCIGHSERVSGAALPLFVNAGTTMYRLARSATA